MPYHKDKQQAFQAAQQALQEVMKTKDATLKDDISYGHQLKHLEQELIAANEQITNALAVASEHQRKELETYQSTLQDIQTEYFS